MFATGSAAHIEQLRTLAAEKQMRLEADGLHKGRTLIAGEEAEIYRALGLPFIDPELREGRGEIEAGLKGKLPKLVTDQDLRGILHCHTDASDGTETLETMAKATRQRGFEYFGVADHSKSAHYAGGLSVEEIAQQHREADRREYAQRSALRGDNPYRAKAYSRAADSLTALAIPLHVLIAEERLTEIPGVGEAIADINAAPRGLPRSAEAREVARSGA